MTITEQPLSNAENEVDLELARGYIVQPPMNGPATEVGLSILAALSVAGVHSSLAPSLFTFSCFAKKPEEQAIARRTLWIALGATTLTSLGILAVFGRILPAIVSQVTAFGLFGLGMMAVNSNGVEEPTMASKPTPTPAPAPAPEAATPGSEIFERRISGFDASDDDDDAVRRRLEAVAPRRVA